MYVDGSRHVEKIIILLNEGESPFQNGDSAFLSALLQSTLLYTSIFL